MGKREFDFPSEVITAVRMRSAWFCNRPTCRNYTVEQAPEGKGWVLKGEAGHINSGASNGPRYDPNLDLNYLRSLDNAIWLCRDCHKVVDARDSDLDAEVLVEWKRVAEEFVATNQHVVGPPAIRVSTSAGTVPTIGKGLITAATTPVDGHVLEIENTGSNSLLALNLRLQWFQEVNRVVVDRSGCPGSIVEVHDTTTPQTPFVKGDARITYSDPGPRKVWRITVSKLLPKSIVAIRMFKEDDADRDKGIVGGLIIHGTSLSVQQPAIVDGALGETAIQGVAESHMVGHYVYAHGTQHFPRDFFAWIDRASDNSFDVKMMRNPPPVEVQVIVQENSQVFGLSGGKEGQAALFGPVIDFAKLVQPSPSDRNNHDGQRTSPSLGMADEPSNDVE